MEHCEAAEHRRRVSLSKMYSETAEGKEGAGQWKTINGIARRTSRLTA